MAFLTSQRGSGSPNVAKAFEKADQCVISIKVSAVASRDKAQAGTITSADIIDGLVGNLQRGKAILAGIATTPGIVEYAASQYADVANYDVAAQFTAMMDEINTTITFFEQNYPKDTDGNIKRLSFVGDGSGNLVSYAAFNQTQRNAIVTRINALLATID